MEIDRLGFICEAYFYGTIGDDADRLIYEPAFYFYMKTPNDFAIRNSTFLEDGTPEHLEWVPLDTDKIIYSEFFKTELFLCRLVYFILIKSLYSCLLF